MTRTTVTQTALAALVVSLACGAVFAQQIAPAESGEVVVRNGKVNAPDAEGIIFSNLDSTPGDRYNSDPFDAFTVAGRNASGQTETWIGILFIPKTDVQAKELSAAVGYVSGTKLVNLGIYSDNGSGTVGTLLPGGQGSTTRIPDLGVCCQLAKVTLAGEGVLLTGGTRYWLVASPDNVNAPTFSGAWQMSNRAESASLLPPAAWSNYPGQWPAAQIRGAKVRALGTTNPAKLEPASPEISAPTANLKIFTDLGPTRTDRYDRFNGAQIRGNAVPSEQETWLAIPFTARGNSHAKTLTAAIGWVSGTRLVNLGIYSDSNGTVGTPLPGGQGSTTQIPDSGDCCDLTRITLPGAGVALTGGTQYWLVASPDDVNAPDFNGLWHESNLAVSAYQQPEFFINWTSFTALWRAAEIRGTNP